tara:strand:+ start:241 stop:699 length:459 start_codon:yes stop_codon:yes gene_type:complete
MAINGVINGSDYILIIDGTYIMYGVSSSMQINLSTKDISCRETDNWNKKLLSNKDWSMSFEGKFGLTYNDGTTNTAHPGLNPITFEQIIDNAYMDQERILLALLPFTDTGFDPANPLWYGEAYISSISIETPNEDSSTIALSFNGVGPLIQN